MPYSDVLLHIDSYPTATAPAVIDEGVRLATRLGRKVSALAVEIDIPLHSNRIADALVGLSAIAEEEEARSAEACREGLARFKSEATRAGVFGEAIQQRTNLYDVAELVARRARTRDLCILPLGSGVDGQREVVSSVVFGSGRPTLVYRAGQAEALASGKGVVVVAWDGSAPAARAMADALPILVAAAEVRILTVVNEKPSAVPGVGAEACRHLATHGVTAVIDEVDAHGDSIGQALESYAHLHEPALIVMGAYGRSRLREFILGGATEFMLAAPPCPLLLSH